MAFPLTDHIEYYILNLLHIILLIIRSIRSHAMGAGGCSNDGTASLYCVRFYTHNP